MPVLQIIHIEAGHHMAHTKARQLFQSALKMLERGNTRNSQNSLSSKEVDDIRLLQ